MTNYIEQIPDGAKVGVAVMAPMASFLGLTVEEWSYTLSSVVALLFILEKLYRAFKWFRNKKCTQQTNGSSEPHQQP